MTTEKVIDDTLSVSEAMTLAKSALETLVVRVLGEVSETSIKPGYKAAYFTVKDNSSSLPCIMWNNRYQSSGIELQVGQLIEITGRFSLYAAKGRMNFDVFSLELAGEGDLRMKVANIARKLDAEGLTSPERKVPIPEFPERIGLVTSPRSAAIHDVLRTLRRRFSLAHILVAGVPVEGTTAAQSIVEGLRCVYRQKPDVILIVRGGGSFEDLMPFNDEALARAIAACPLPIVTGIGHEVDTTIADMVSDYRASTPTAAAEAVSPSADTLASLFTSYRNSLELSINRSLEFQHAHLEHIASRPFFKDPYTLFSSEALSLDTMADRLSRSIPVNIARARISFDTVSDRFIRVIPRQLQHMKENLKERESAFMRSVSTAHERYTFQVSRSAARLADLSPVSTLARGYSISRNAEGHIIRSINHVKPHELITVMVADGQLSCRVEQNDAGDSPALQKGTN